MVIRDQEKIKWPNPLRPNVGNREQYCHFHRSRGYTTEACKQLKDEIDRLIQQGYLRQCIKDPLTLEVTGPAGGQNQRQQRQPLNKIQMKYTILIASHCAPPKGNFRRGATRTRRVRSHYPEGQNGRRPLRSSQAEEPMGRPVRSHIRSAIKGIGPHLHTSMDDNICNLNTVAGFPHPIHQLEWEYSRLRILHYPLKWDQHKGKSLGIPAQKERKGPNWLGQHTRPTSTSGGTRESSK
ncbi:hypothetical protein M5K25_014977 [Dendrobium thyrsiflorum]|uniref:Reverse transcriptase domain-containing protein n=1 Tax=Dendrobium thyrsiflorum TaxID=117978 RepID=A0ABD0UP28_DENTH